MIEIVAPASPTNREQLLVPARVLSTDGLRDDLCVWLRDGRIHALPPKNELAALTHLPRQDLNDALLAPGFVDLQVNGGGGLLFNDAPTPETLRVITRAHRRFGTTALLATLISDRPERTQQAISAVREGLALGIPGLLGLHLEGPHLAPSRCGVHAAEYFTDLDNDAVDALLAERSGPLLLTLAPEHAEPALIARLSTAGVRVFAGHSAASFEQVQAALAAGLCGFTHLFNAMPPLAGRAPGPVGAALLDADSWCGLIVDGHHLHPASVRLALHCKPRGRCLLVTDAMPSLGTDLNQFSLYGSRVHVRNGRLETDAGVLAGAQLDMAQAVRECIRQTGIGVDEALRMASTYPAAAMGLQNEFGCIAPGARADLVWLDAALQPRGSWIAGEFEPA
jgi:N-acetylglucosamine-6-phosphate deacetylase